jgi:sulfur-carrier protein
MVEVKMKVKVFGKLVEMVGSTELEFSACTDLDSLKRELKQTYPAMNNVQFAIALNNKISAGNSVLQEEDQIALLPPFSGG